MEYTKTQQAVMDYARGMTTAEAAVAHARATAAPPPDGYPPADYDVQMAAMETDDATTLDMEGWDGIVSLYVSGQLTAEQFNQLFTAYTRTGG